MIFLRLPIFHTWPSSSAIFRFYYYLFLSGSLKYFKPILAITFSHKRLVICVSLHINRANTVRYILMVILPKPNLLPFGYLFLEKFLRYPPPLFPPCQ